MRVLFLTHRLPYAPNRGDRVRAYHILRGLARTADVDLLSLVHTDEEAGHIGDLKSFTASVTGVRVARLGNLVRTALSLPTSRPATHTMLDSPDLGGALVALAAKRPDVVLAYCSGMARCALEPALRSVPMVLDMVDVDSAKWAALAASGAGPRSWLYAREARVLRAFEGEASRHAVATMVVTAKERQTMEAIEPAARVEVVPNGVDVAPLRPPGEPVAEPRVVFCGVMNYAPNEEAVIWFGREVWPLVTARRPDARFDIVGSHPTAALQQLAESAPGITVVGEVPSVAPYLWRSAISVAPLLTARGVQNKVLEAVAAGLPAVVTPVVAEGLPRVVLPSCRVAAAAPEFAAAVLELLEWSPERRRQMAAAADFETLSWDRTVASVQDLLTEAVSRA